MSQALERQIKPIYDSLDTGSNKSAIVACNKLLKKYPKNELIKSLKALALVRSQKVEEALVLCDELLQAKPTDDPVLTALMHCLRGLGRHKDMVTMFEDAYKQQPANEELGIQTFFANVRAANWKSAQLIATKMHKQFQEDRYIFWNAISAVLQARDPATPPGMQTILFKLAHRLLESCTSPTYLIADRFYLHLFVLRELQLYDDAHKLLDSEIGTVICNTNLSCNEIRRDIWKRRGMVAEEGARGERRIIEQKDRNWLEFLAVLDATFEGPEKPTAESIEHAVHLFTSVAEIDGTKDRTGLLALLEVEKRARQSNLSTDPGRLPSLLRDYFGRIGGKACCFEDLKPYLAFEGNEKSEWASFLQGVATTADTISNLQRSINAHKILRFMLDPSQVTVESESTLLSTYVDLYLSALPLGADLPSTELQPADDFALLAGNTLVSLWKLTSDAKHLQNAAILLEFALGKSKHSFQSRLLLIRVYRLLGAPSLAVDYYRGLQVKQVQHDTLSHFLLSRASNFSLAASGDLTFSSECLESSQIYLSNTQETGDFIVRAFTSEKYSQIPEFIEFEDRLENSLQRDLVKIEHLRMRTTHEVITSDLIDMELIELKFIFDRTHHDNRDFDILANYQPHFSKSLNEQTLLFNLPAEGHGWLHVFMQVYIRALQQGSDLDDTVEEKLLIGDRPKQSPDPEKRGPLKERLKQVKEECLTELTPDEVLLVTYAKALADWLEPYHDHVRPPPAVVLAEAAKQTELKTGFALRGIEIPPLNGNGNGKKDEEAPAIADPPQEVVEFFAKIKARFEVVVDQPSLNDILQVATLAQEAFMLFVIETLRFKSPSVVKIHKLGALTNSFKPIRATALEVLKFISAGLTTRSEKEGSTEVRTAFIDGFSESLSNKDIDQEFVQGIAKKTTESRKKVLEGVGKGLLRVCSNYSTN
ncbi:actin cytoskeleton organization protein [Pluteus cervinus]|uniref:Actin cytoskeleton organization protein n=1 Tax=Pluteus cervinus TaxID=181527 RepID=A0ACD3BEF8_9AGAR|nr:actin cytoskeleton organization protein [Pluteus cervinus]